jgi:uncharacterized protein (DUF169 family)
VNRDAGQAACADSAVLPYLSGNINSSLGCFGCRKTTDLAPEEMLVGVPGTKLEGIVAAVDEMREGPIMRSRTR